MSEQRSKEWFELKCGRFSASRASELLTNSQRKMTDKEMEAYKLAEPKGRKSTIDGIGESLETYALEMAIQSIYGLSDEDTFVSFDMQRGILLEKPAFDCFTLKKQPLFLTTAECEFIPYGEHAGASPDGYVSDNSGIEIKCPKRVNYFKHVVNGIDEIDKKYIDQMQFQMLCAGTDKTYFVNYLLENNKEFLHEIIIDRDEERISFIKERLEYAIERKLHFINQIKNNTQL
jgi:hypothetical protein